MTAGVEFGLLGALLVRCRDELVEVPRGKQRTVLAALLLKAGQVVPVEDLAELLWGASPPPSMRVTTQNYVKRLRQALGGEARDRIRTHPGGYSIQVAPDELDVSRFEALVASAVAAAHRGAWDEAAAQGDAALGLWRGEPLADTGSAEMAAREGQRLAELRLQVLEARLEAHLHLGLHAVIIDELRQLTDSHPLREHLRALLMKALYLCGRQAEALALYHDVRRTLIEELAVEPGAELRELYQRILAGDPALDTPATPLRQELASPAMRLGDDFPARVVPRQLPRVAAHFTGRAAELAVLDQMLGEASGQQPGTALISVVGGTAGVGKTTLALHWAHRVAGQFADGQLYINLRGFDPVGTPVTPAEAVCGFLGALGVPAERIPPDADAQAGLYRSLVAGRKMLIMLDNARDEQQVRPVLPASPASLVLITSRNALGGLAAAEDARLISLDVLTRGEAVQLLIARLGASRAAAEPAAVDEIARLCARLPLALTVAAALAAGRPGFPLAGLAAELRGAAGRLDVLDAGDPEGSVRAVFSSSYRQLSCGAARVFRLLGLHPGPDITVPAAASLAGENRLATRRLLGELVRAHLVTEHTHGRYAFHDLLRAYAAAQADEADSEADRTAAVVRLLDYYLHTARSAVALLFPAREPIAVAQPGPGAAPERFDDHKGALAWFEAERDALLAAVTLAADSGFDRHTWQLALTTGDLLDLQGHVNEEIRIQRMALDATIRLGDTVGQALSSRLLGDSLSMLGNYDQAVSCHRASLKLYRQAGDRRGQATVYQNLALVSQRQGRPADALRHAERALTLCRMMGDRQGEAFLLNDVGWYHALQGDHRRARAFCRQALALVTVPTTEMCIWDSLGYAELHLGNYAEAAACYRRSLSLAREYGSRAVQLSALDHLGDTLQATGDLHQAREAWQEALAILEVLDHPDTQKVRTKLASIRDQDPRGG